MALPDDLSIRPVLEELAACLCAELTANGTATPCFCGVIVGMEEVPNVGVTGCDDCAAGYVRLETGFPSTQRFPQQDEAATCRAVLAFSVTVGVLRCAPTGDDFGNPPSQDEISEYGRIILADMSAMRRAIRCCLTDDKFEGINYALGGYSPTVVAGGSGGGEWTLTIQERY